MRDDGADVLVSGGTVTKTNKSSFIAKENKNKYNVSEQFQKYDANELNMTQVKTFIDSQLYIESKYMLH